MALTGTLMQASASFYIGVTVPHLQATIYIKDDGLGELGTRTVTVADAATQMQVRAFVEQMLPLLSAEVGIPVTLPPVTPPDVP